MRFNRNAGSSLIQLLAGVTLLLFGALPDAAPAIAQVGVPYDLSWYTVDSGDAGLGGNYSIRSTVGQPDASVTQSGGQFQASGGFLHRNIAPPLAITLGWFLAERAENEISFRWQTITESGMAGFRIVTVVDGERVPLHTELVPSPVIDSLQSTEYTFTSVTLATRFYLQAFNVDGAMNEYGPFELGVAEGSYTSTGGEDTPTILLLPMVANASSAARAHPAAVDDGAHSQQRSDHSDDVQMDTPVDPLPGLWLPLVRTH